MWVQNRIISKRNNNNIEESISPHGLSQCVKMSLFDFNNNEIERIIINVKHTFQEVKRKEQ